MSLRVHFQDVPRSERARSECQDLALGLEEEFPETTKFEVSISRSREEYAAHLHVTGKDVSVNSNAQGRELLEALREAFDKAHRQLRRHHDKVIFGRRREAQKSSRK